MHHKQLVVLYSARVVLYRRYVMNKTRIGSDSTRGTIPFSPKPFMNGVVTKNTLESVLALRILANCKLKVVDLH